jgi:4,5-dihydroxyphthalate decarboxylase
MPPAMTILSVSLGLVDHCETTAAIANGSVAPQGIDCRVSTTSPADLFRRQAQLAEFDVAEMSISTFVAMHARADQRFVGLPIFPRRAFRHGFIFVNRTSGIAEPKQLEGHRVGVSEYQQTASLWIRGILRDEYGVETDRIEWHEGGLHERAQPERYAIELPARTRLRGIGPDQTLNEMLVAGEIDALIGAQRPRSFTSGVAGIERLIPDHRRVEQNYYRRTGLYPPMHMIVVRRTLLEQDPWIAQSLCDAFENAKRDADDRLRSTAARTGSIPWLLDDIEEIERVFGSLDFRPYGFPGNRRVLDKITEMSLRDALVPMKVDAASLFAESVRDWDPTVR